MGDPSAPLKQPFRIYRASVRFGCWWDCLGKWQGEASRSAREEGGGGDQRDGIIDCKTILYFYSLMLDVSDCHCR